MKSRLKHELVCVLPCDEAALSGFGDVVDAGCKIMRMTIKLVINPPATAPTFDFVDGSISVSQLGPSKVVPAQSQVNAPSNGASVSSLVGLPLMHGRSFGPSRV